MTVGGFILSLFFRAVSQVLTAFYESQSSVPNARRFKRTILLINSSFLICYECSNKYIKQNKALRGIFKKPSLSRTGGKKRRIATFKLGNVGY